MFKLTVLKIIKIGFWAQHPILYLAPIRHESFDCVLFGILAIHPIGNYAVLLAFDDGDDTGIYSWDTLYRLGREQSQRWADYLQALREAGQSRDAPIASSDTGEQA